MVIDRLADVMKLADGSHFSPQFVENKLKFSPYIREAVVFGRAGAPFVTAMIAIDMENAGQWAERRRIPYTTFTDLARRRQVYTLVREHVAEVNRELPAAARIHRFLLLHKELHADDAELTRTLKVRRRHIADRFAEIIRALQGDAGFGDGGDRDHLSGRAHRSGGTRTAHRDDGRDVRSIRPVNETLAGVGRPIVPLADRAALPETGRAPSLTLSGR